MRKLIHLLFAVSLLLYFSTVIVSAETAAYKNFQNVYEEAEFQAVMDTVENDPFIQEANVLGAALEDGAAVQPMNPYKLYAMPAVDFKNFTGNERDITGNDSDNYLWVLPVSNGNVIRVQSIENNWPGDWLQHPLRNSFGYRYHRSCFPAGNYGWFASLF